MGFPVGRSSVTHTVAVPTQCPLLCFRLVRRQEETKAQRGQMKQLKGLMHGLVNVTGDPEKQQLDAIRNARQLAFLITDLQDSTAMASANPVAFRKVQDIHDTVSFLLRQVQDIHNTVITLFCKDQDIHNTLSYLPHQFQGVHDTVSSL